MEAIVTLQFNGTDVTVVVPEAQCALSGLIVDG